MSNRTDKAKQLFNSGFNCAQSIFASYAEESGLTEAQALKISCGFGGGMAHQQKTCGAVTGAYMVLGMKYGKFISDDDAARDTTYAYVNKFTRQFTDIHQSTECRALLQCDLNTEEGKRFHQEHQLRKTVCTPCVETAVDILEAFFRKQY